MSSPPTLVELVWNGDLEFAASLSKHTVVLDSNGAAGPSPVEMLAAALAGCMAIDLVHILQRGRHTLRSLRAKLLAERAADAPKRFTAVTLHFEVEGSVPREAVNRAVELSRTKYCSVWHSMRQDIDLQVT
ncbi:MAG: OsmC family protein, partial [Vicinamibacterales bacterium]